MSGQSAQERKQRKPKKVRAEVSVRLGLCRRGRPGQAAGSSSPGTQRAGPACCKGLAPPRQSCHCFPEFISALLMGDVQRTFLLSWGPRGPLVIPLPGKTLPSHLIPMHPVTTHPIPTHPIPTRPIPTHPIPTQLNSSHPNTSHPIPPHPRLLLSQPAQSLVCRGRWLRGSSLDVHPAAGKAGRYPGCSG